MRRAEMARRRKNLSEKRNEEEKVSQYRSHLCLFGATASSYLSSLVLHALRCPLNRPPPPFPPLLPSAIDNNDRRIQ